MSSQASYEETANTRHRLERPWARHTLIHELARGEKTQQVLADQHGVSQAAISKFGSKYADKIAKVRADLEDEFADLWVIQKGNRLAELENLIESIRECVDDPDDRFEAVKHIQSLLRAVAEETGQIPNKATVSLAQPVVVRLEGVNTDDL